MNTKDKLRAGREGSCPPLRKALEEPEENRKKIELARRKLEMVRVLRSLEDEQRSAQQQKERMKAEKRAKSEPVQTVEIEMETSQMR